MYIIKDWAGNVFDFRGKFMLPQFAVALEFDDIDSANEFIEVNFDDETLEDIFVERESEC